MKWERLPAGPGAVALVLYGAPVPKGRPRAQPGGGRSYTPAETEQAEDTWRLAIRVTHRGLRPDVASPFSLSVTFYLPDRRRRDIDNLLKLVMDAANAVVYRDDSQVVEVHAKMVYADPRPRTEAVFVPLPVG